MARIVCFGEALVDLIARAPEPRRPPCYEQYAGGAPANVATAIARLGGDAAFVGMLAADLFGDFLLASLREAGVDIRFVPRTAAAQTALAFVALDAGGERSFSFYRSGAADQLFCAEDFDPACFDGVAAFHACSNSLTDELLAEATFAGMRRAREAGGLVSFDVNLRPALWRPDDDPAPAIGKALARADVVKMSREELDYLAARSGGEDRLLASLWRGRARLAIVTNGAAPLRFLTRERQGGLPVFPARAVDTTAAGDAFMGGFLQWIVQAFPEGVDFTALPARLGEGLRFAAACGALAVSRRGSFAAMPAGDDVRRFLEEQS